MNTMGYRIKWRVMRKIGIVFEATVKDYKSSVRNCNS